MQDWLQGKSCKTLLKTCTAVLAGYSGSVADCKGYHKDKGYFQLLNGQLYDIHYLIYSYQYSTCADTISDKDPKAILLSLVTNHHYSQVILCSSIHSLSFLNFKDYAVQI